MRYKLGMALRRWARRIDGRLSFDFPAHAKASVQIYPNQVIVSVRAPGLDKVRVETPGKVETFGGGGGGGAL